MVCLPGETPKAETPQAGPQDDTEGANHIVYCIVLRDTIISFPTVIQQWQYSATHTEPLHVAHAGKAEDCAYTWVSLAMRRRRPILASDMRSRSSATGLPASGLPAGLLCTECPLCHKSRIAQLAICRQFDIIKQGSGEAPE